MRIGTWNVRGITNKLKEVTSEIKELNLDIVCITETKKKGQGSAMVDDYVHIWSGVPKSERAKAGVAVLIKKIYNKHIQDIQFITERHLKIVVRIRNIELVIVAVYAPTNDTMDAVKDTFYDTLDDILQGIKKHQQLILAGDLNARVGSRQNDEVVGQYGEIRVNDNGERLINICKQHELKINNSFYNHKEIHRYTWEKPSLNQKSILDYIITRQKPHFKVVDTRVKRGANCSTDHYLLVSKILPQYSAAIMKRKEKISDTKETVTKEVIVKYNLYLLQDESIRDLYQRRLTNLLNKSTTEGDVEKDHQNIVEAIHQAARESLGESNNEKRRNQIWWNDQLKECVKLKKQAYQNWLVNQTVEKWNIYRKLNREVKNKIKEGKNLCWERKCLEIESLIGGSRSSEVWRCLKGMKINNNTRTANQINMEDWTMHYKKLLIEDRDHYQTTEINNRNGTHRNMIRITEDELHNVIKTMKNGRAPGAGNTYTELIKCGGQALRERLCHLVNNCIEQCVIPEQWKTSYMISIYKKGERNDKNNYRGLSVNCTLSRLFGKILNKKLKESAEHKISEEQSGFVTGRGCVDNLFIIQQLTEKRRDKGEETHLAFIDLEKAYDSIPRKRLWEALLKLNIDEDLINIIKEMYRGNKTFVKQNGYLSDPIVTSKGLRQGCSLSPLLFNLYIECALEDWRRRVHGMGIPINDHHLYTLNFADDQIVMAQDAYDLEFMLRRLYHIYEEWGLKVNTKKTEYLVTNSVAKFTILINDETEIKQVDKYKYLGVTITTDGFGSAEIKSRIEQSKRIIGCLNSVWWDKHIHIKTKKHIGKALVESVLCYGSEIWTINAEHRRKINTVEMDYLRRSAGISKRDHITNEEIRNKMKAQETVLDRIELGSLKWFGHLMRMEESRWPSRIFRWKPPGRRKKGRPRRSWNEGIRAAMEARGLTAEDAEDRVAWRIGTGRRRIAV